MTRHRLTHPADPDLYLVAGHNHALGLFAHVLRTDSPEPLHTLDASSGNARIKAEDTFRFVVEHGFISEEDLDLCKAHMMAGTRRPSHVVPMSYVMAACWSVDCPV